MKIFVAANEQQFNELISINAGQNNEFIFSEQLPEGDTYQAFDVFFIFSEGWRQLDFQRFGSKPVFINMVEETLRENNLPAHISRFNGWPGFIQRKLWEIASYDPPIAKDVFKALNRKISIVQDEPGLVSARVISMIINEAFFALGEQISTSDEIDTAMKLGTNYPYGPFEWAEKISIERIYRLLQRLSETDERYCPAPALKEHYLEASGIL